MDENEKIVVVAAACSAHLNEAERMVREKVAELGAGTGLIVEFPGNCSEPQSRPQSNRKVVGFSRPYAEAYDRIKWKVQDIKQ